MWIGFNMETRPYNKNKDSFYSPDSTPMLYLFEQDILTALDDIPLYEGESEIEVRGLIADIETLNRKEKMGEISPELCLKRNKELADSFLDKYGFWPYITKTYEAFYQYFEREK